MNNQYQNVDAFFSNLNINQNQNQQQPYNSLGQNSNLNNGFVYNNIGVNNNNHPNQGPKQNNNDFHKFLNSNNELNTPVPKNFQDLIFVK